ncbi:MAG: glycosyltransferase family 4 protein [Deltaproteobacteria bacterium]|uniref:Glycosyltransferase family 4 protein n=1 Tax=Candidatus Zymogenus saltonus TaxID=2844893 RepID=A0A9D8KEW9_9DELT|nr:glycosyltransferase family 4 protein [Candidatus Zymogenus saltonus]
MKTILLTNDYPPTISGISTLFYRIWLFLPDGEDLILAPGVEGGRDFDEESGRGAIRYPAIPVNSLFIKAVNFAIQFFYALRLALRHRVRLIHAGQILNGGAIGYVLKKIFGIPYVIWVYGDETKPIYMRSPVHRYLIDRLIRGADRIISVSPVITEEFLDYGVSAEKIVEIIPGVDTETFSPGEPPMEMMERYGVKGKTVLMTVARLTPRKGQDTVISALPGILKKHPDVVYLIVGDGPYRRSLEKLSVDKGVYDSVIFAGRVVDSELPDHYRLSDIYVMPNREVKDSTDSIEGFGISFIEAGASAKPVVGGRSGGAVFAVEDGGSGILVDPEDAGGLTDAVIGLIDDPRRAEDMGRRGLERARTFDWRLRAEEISELHREYEESRK